MGGVRESRGESEPGEAEGGETMVRYIVWENNLFTTKDKKREKWNKEKRKEERKKDNFPSLFFQLISELIFYEAVLSLIDICMYSIITDGLSQTL